MLTFSVVFLGIFDRFEKPRIFVLNSSFVDYLLWVLWFDCTYSLPLLSLCLLVFKFGLTWALKLGFLGCGLKNKGYL